MTRRERLERKATRRREWADKRRDKYQAEKDSIPEYASDWNFITQPGGKAAKLRRRINKKDERAYEHAKMANYHDDKADRLERQLDRSIYSDDRDAIEQLEQKIAGLDAERQRIKKYNRLCKNPTLNLSQRMAQADLQPSEVDDLLTLARVAAFQLGKNGEFPGYKLSSISQEIRRCKKRIEDLTTRKERTA